tara:strand:- start:189 stop:836 length:648 start_codon:yes stop_codon:yes gene_type:complete
MENALDKLIQSFRSDFGKFYTITYFGEILGQKQNKVYFKPANNIPIKLLQLKEIKELKQNNKVLIKNGKWKIEPENMEPYDGTFIDIVELNKEKLSIPERAMIDAKNDANKWVLYPPTAFLTFGAIMLGSEEEPWEYFPATLGISAASLTIPYLFFKELTWKNTENLNSKNKELYEKVYFKNFQKRKSKIIVFSSVVTGVLGPILYVSAVVSGLS